MLTNALIIIVTAAIVFGGCLTLLLLIIVVTDRKSRKSKADLNATILRNELMRMKRKQGK